MKTIQEKTQHLTTDIRLPGMRQNYAMVVEEFKNKSNQYEQFLYKLLEIEHASREQSRKASRVRQAKFPYRKSLEDLSLEDLPIDAQNKLPELETLDFIEQGQNIILTGNPGTGKTHLSIALGIKACQNNYKVLFTTVSRLITLLKESRSERTLGYTESRFEKYDLVICDEFGYISFDKQGAELLFSHLSLRAGVKSTIITTNLSFDRWNEIFGDTILTAAMVDRLTHKAHIVKMNGKSYRTKETAAWLKK